MCNSALKVNLRQMKFVQVVYWARDICIKSTLKVNLRQVKFVQVINRTLY